jgi:Na+/pantothenate symporter
MAINSLVGDVTSEIIEYIYLQAQKKKNKRKLKYIYDTVISILFSDLKPYLYTILAILILMFIMNCFSFYYYIRLFIESNPNININDIR